MTHAHGRKQGTLHECAPAGNKGTQGLRPPYMLKLWAMFGLVGTQTSPGLLHFRQQHCSFTMNGSMSSPCQLVFKLGQLVARHDS